MTPRLRLVAALLAAGIAWGATQPLAKIAVSEGYRQFGLIFWQLALSALLIGAGSAVLRRRLRFDLHHWRLYLVIALIGTLIPNSASYTAAVHLPAGVLSILIALVPMYSLPMAVLLRQDRASPARLAGLGLGFLGVVLLMAPEASLPERAMIAFVPLAMVAPFFYAFEGNYVARRGTDGLTPLELLFGASVLGTLLALPLALGSGQFIVPPWPLGRPDWAMVLNVALHVAAYGGYLWIIGRAGAVFSAQVSYMVTLAGVGWSMAILGESYTGWVWLALLCMIAGLALVQPRPGPGQTSPAPR